LLHDKLDILVLKSFFINFLAIILIVLSLGSDGFVFAVAVVMVVVVIVVVTFVVTVVVARMIFDVGELLGCSSLGLRVEIFYLGFSKDAVKGLVFACLVTGSVKEWVRTSRCCCSGICRHLGC
jgi:hypothetical protein